MLTKPQVARAGEDAAAQYLSSRGYTVLNRNYRTRTGEIDLICQKNEALVFVEVKTRTSTKYGLPSEAVNYRKQQKIIAAAMQYVSEYKLYHKAFQFDVIEVFLESAKLRCNHIPNAFGR